MHLITLDLYNYGVYRGYNRLSFSPGKPIVLVGGLNGRGKTTLLEAVLIALYGPNSSAYIESGYTTFGQYLRAHTNTDAGNNIASIRLTFSHEMDGAQDTLTVERMWKASTKHIRVTTKVWRNGSEDEFLTENWSSYVEGIFPRALAKFFFFDGEKVAEMALDGSDSQIRESIRVLLGVSTVDVLRRDLKTISRRKKNQSMKASSTEADELAVEVDTLKDKIQSIDEEIRKLTADVGTLDRTIEILQSDYIAAGGDAAAQRAEHQERLRQLEAQLEQVTQDEILLSAGDAPLVMFFQSLPSLQQRARREHERKVLKEAILQMEELLARYQGEKDNIADFLLFAGSELDNSSGKFSFEVTDDSLATLSGLIKEMPALKSEFHKLIVRKHQIQRDINATKDYLSVVIDEEALKEIRITLETTTQKLDETKARILALQEERSGLNGEYIRQNAKYKRAMKKYLASLNNSEDGDRIIAYATLAGNIFEQYAIRVQERKTSVLASAISECYQLLANKRSLIEHVEMDPKTLEITYIGPDGNLVDRQILSAGERQLMVIATLWALAKCSDRKLPVIIDTPLARLDSAHRMSIVESYFPNASEQVIILSTDSEIFGQYYEAIKPNTADEYTLVYNDHTRATTIRRGYFAEVG